MMDLVHEREKDFNAFYFLNEDPLLLHSRTINPLCETLVTLPTK